MFQNVNITRKLNDKQKNLLNAIKQATDVNGCLDAFNSMMVNITVPKDRAKMALVMLEVWAQVGDKELFNAAIGATGVDDKGKPTAKKVLTSTMLTEAREIVLESKSITKDQLKAFYDQLTKDQKKTFLTDVKAAGRSQEHYKFIVDTIGFNLISSDKGVTDELKSFIKDSLDVDTARDYINTLLEKDKKSHVSFDKKDELYKALFSDLAVKDIGVAIEWVDYTMQYPTIYRPNEIITLAIDSIVTTALSEKDASKRNNKISALADAAVAKGAVKVSLIMKLKDVDLNNLTKETAEKLVGAISPKVLLSGTMAIDAPIYKAVVDKYMNGAGNLADLASYDKVNVVDYVVAHYRELSPEAIAKLYAVLSDKQKTNLEANLNIGKLTEVVKAIVSNKDGALDLGSILKAVHDRDTRLYNFFNEADLYKDMVSISSDIDNLGYLNQIVAHVLANKISLGKDAIKSMITETVLDKLLYDNVKGYLDLLVRNKDIDTAGTVMHSMLTRQTNREFGKADDEFVKELVETVKDSKDLMSDLLSKFQSDTQLSNMVVSAMLNNIDKLGYKNVMDQIQPKLIEVDGPVRDKAVTKMIENKDIGRARTVMKAVFESKAFDTSSCFNNFGKAMVQFAPTQIYNDDIEAVILASGKDDVTANALIYRMLCRGKDSLDVALLESVLLHKSFKFFNYDAKKNLVLYALRYDKAFFINEKANSTNREIAFDLIKAGNVQYAVDVTAAVLYKQELPAALAIFKDPKEQAELIEEMLKTADADLKEKLYQFVIADLAEGEFKDELRTVTIKLLGEMNIMAQTIALDSLEKVKNVYDMLNLDIATPEEKTVIDTYLTKLIIGSFVEGKLGGNILTILNDTGLNIPTLSEIRNAVLSDDGVIKHALLALDNSESVGELTRIDIVKMIKIYKELEKSLENEKNEQRDRLHKGRLIANIADATINAVNNVNKGELKDSNLVTFFEEQGFVKSFAAGLMSQKQETYETVIPAIYQNATPQGAANLAAAMIGEWSHVAERKEMVIDQFLNSVPEDKKAESSKLLASQLTEVNDVVRLFNGDRLRIMEWIVTEICKAPEVSNDRVVALKNYYAEHLNFQYGKAADVKDQKTQERVDAVKELCKNTSTLEEIFKVTHIEVAKDNDKKVYVENMLMLDIESLVAIEKAYQNVHKNDGVEKGFLDIIAEFINSAIIYVFGRGADVDKGVQSFVDLMQDEGLIRTFGSKLDDTNGKEREGKSKKADFTVDAAKKFENEALSHVERLARSGTIENKKDNVVQGK
ncbi:MAG: hypothetical protein ACK5WS_04240 [Alphaproteobacteria bacterium]|jgi:hypothetical protein